MEVEVRTIGWDIPAKDLAKILNLTKRQIQSVASAGARPIVPVLRTQAKVRKRKGPGTFNIKGDREQGIQGMRDVLVRWFRGRPAYGSIPGNMRNTMGSLTQLGKMYGRALGADHRGYGNPVMSYTLKKGKHKGKTVDIYGRGKKKSYASYVYLAYNGYDGYGRGLLDPVMNQTASNSGKLMADRATKLIDRRAQRFYEKSR